MDRINMIRVLAGIAEGTISPSDLVPGRGYWLDEVTRGVFRDRHTGIAYSQNEIDAIYRDMERRNAIRAELLGDNLPEPMVIINLPPPEAIKPAEPIDISEKSEVVVSTEKPTAPEKEMKPVVVQQEEVAPEKEEPILLRNITNQFLY